MLYVLIPHRAQGQEDVRFFTSFGAAEQAMIQAARGYLAVGDSFDWAILMAYEGTDELLPVFVYTLMSPTHLHRERVPSPSP
jgi:hypothetical protein